MCWIGNNSSAFEMVAEKDIKVFKVVYVFPSGIYSPFRNYEYQIGKEEKSEFQIVRFLTEYMITSGLHSYSSKCQIHYGFVGHDVLSPNGANIGVYRDQFPRSITCVLQCLIPKGSKYYINELGECVSNKLIPVKLIELSRLKPN